MSVSYWVIEGIGIDADQVEPFINKKKLANMLLRKCPNHEGLMRIHTNQAYDELNVEDFLYGTPFENLGELLVYCDDTYSLVYGDDGADSSYFYYPPSMPWNRRDNEPDTLEEVHRRIIKAVRSITDLSAADIEKMIDDHLYVVGIG